MGDDGTPVTLRDGHLVVPLPETTLAALPPEALDFSDGRTLVDLTLRHRRSGDERFLATASARSRATAADDSDGGAAVGGSVDAAVDPAAVSGGQPLARGIWDVWVKVRAYGWERATRVGIYRAPGVAAAVRPALVGTPPLVVTPYWTEPGNLALDVGPVHPQDRRRAQARPRALGGAHRRRRAGTPRCTCRCSWASRCRRRCG